MLIMIVNCESESVSQIDNRDLVRWQVCSESRHWTDSPAARCIALSYTAPIQVVVSSRIQCVEKKG